MVVSAIVLVYIFSYIVFSTSAMQNDVFFNKKMICRKADLQTTFTLHTLA